MCEDLRIELASQTKTIDNLTIEVGNLKSIFPKQSKELREVKSALEDVKHDRNRLQSKAAEWTAFFSREAISSYFVASSVLEGLGARVAPIGTVTMKCPRMFSSLGLRRNGAIYRRLSGFSPAMLPA